jgi:hypothetical protein
MVSMAYPVPSRVAAPAASPPSRGAGHSGPPPVCNLSPLPRAREDLRLPQPPSCGHQPEARGQRRGHGGDAGRERWGGAGGRAKRPFEFPTKSQPPFGHTPPLCGGPLCCMRRAETTTYRARILNACGLCYLLQSYRIAHAFKSLESPLTFAFLLSRQQAIIPFLLIKSPL